MYNQGPIVVIEDDLEDQDLLKEAFADAAITNEIVFFDNGPEAFTYLKGEGIQPFFIICDVNMPKQNGIDFKRDIDSDPELRLKSIPFIFYTTYVSQYAVNEAYSQLTVQGFFQKTDTFYELRDAIKLIIQYWRLCKQPDYRTE